MTDTMLAYLFRAAWGIFLGLMLAGSFKNTWDREHGRKKDRLLERNDTVILYDPLVFPVCIAIYAGLLLVTFGQERSRGFTFSLGLDLFLFISIYFSLVLFLLPFLRRRYTARTCAALWLIPVFLFYQPNIMYTSAVLPTKAVFYIPRMAADLLLFLWLSGFVLLLLLQVISHLRFSRMLKAGSRPVEESALLDLWKRTKQKLDIGDLKRPIALRYSPLIRTPLTIGMYRTNWVTYLPERSFSEEEAGLIFSHELHHIQRHDTHTKFFLKFCCALGWLHPLVWLAVRRAEEDLELSCDEIVLKDAGPETRRRYADLLLTIAGDARGYTTCLSASAKSLRYRLKSTVSTGKKRLGLVLLFLILSVSSMLTGNLSLTSDRGPIAEVAGVGSTDVENVRLLDGDGRYEQEDIRLQDMDALSRYLETLQAECFLTLYSDGDELKRPSLYGTFSDTGERFFLDDDCLTVYSKNGPDLRQYHIYTPPDWDYIRSL